MNIPSDAPPAYDIPSTVSSTSSNRLSVPVPARSSVSIHSDSTDSDDDDREMNNASAERKHDLVDAHRELPEGWVREMDPTYVALVIIIKNVSMYANSILGLAGE